MVHQEDYRWWIQKNEMKNIAFALRKENNKKNENEIKDLFNF